jgi:hypothetical protein
MGQGSGIEISPSLRKLTFHNFLLNQKDLYHLTKSDRAKTNMDSPYVGETHISNHVY